MLKRTGSSNQMLKWVAFGLLGLALGACLALVSAAGLLFFRASGRLVAGSPASVVTGQPTLASPPGSATAALKTTSTPSPADAEFNRKLEEAEAALESGDLARARDLLTPLLDQTSDPAALARINGDLGDLGMQLGRYRLASGYYEQQYAYERTPEVLIKLADSCTISGKLEEADRRYQELLDWSGSDADPYREQAKEALVHVRDMLGTQVPTTMP